MVVEKKLHDLSYQQNLKKERTHEEQKVYDQMKKYMQLMLPEEFELFVKGNKRCTFRCLTCM